MRRYTAAIAAAAFVALLAVGAAIGADPGYGTALSPERLERALGGACADTKCVAETCVTNAGQNACGIQTSTCTRFLNSNNQWVCYSIRINPGEVCNDPPGQDKGWNCSQSTGANPCAEYWSGNLNAQGGCINGTVIQCAATGQFCGSVRHSCTQTPCGSGQ